MPSDDLPPPIQQKADGRVLALWYIDPDGIDEALESPDSPEVTRARLVNPFELTVEALGQSKVIVLPAWVGWVGIVIFGIAILGGNTTNFWDALKKGARKIGRALRKIGRAIGKVFGW